MRYILYKEIILYEGLNITCQYDLLNAFSKLKVTLTLRVCKKLSKSICKAIYLHFKKNVILQNVSVMFFFLHIFHVKYKKI